ncbi:MAG: GAF domain-containing protein, partial [Gammaproteobacteria bacterium]
MAERMSLKMQDYNNESDRAEMLAAELDTLFRVSQVLSQSLNLTETLQGVLLQMHENGGLRNGMVSLVQPDKSEMLLSAVHGDTEVAEVRYRSGEGVVGSILAEGRTVVVNRISDEPRFLGRLGLYDKDLAFIGVPIRVKGELVGVLAAQPNERLDSLLDERAYFLEMVANLIGQAVRLSWEVEKERSALQRERDSLKRQVRGNYGFSNMVGHTAVMKRVFELIRQVAKWDTTVLIRGESGTGKELIANAIHYNSPRS